MVKKAQRQEQEAAGHIAYAVRKQGVRNAGLAHFLLFIHPRSLVHARVLPTSGVGMN